MSNVIRHSFCKNTLFFNNFQTFMRFFSNQNQLPLGYEGKVYELRLIST